MCRPLAFSLLLAVAACSEEPQPVRFCTEIGCDAGLYVRFSHQPSRPFTVEAQASGGPLHRAECLDQAQGCLGGVFMADLVADSMELRFVTATDTFSSVVRPQYGPKRPNGPDCPPFNCRVAYVTVELPRGW